VRAPDFWATNGPAARLLAPAGLAVDLAGRVRRTVVQPKHAPVPVICVGNLVTGGAGKTPVVRAVVRLMVERGLEAHVLMRGYGGRERGPLRVDPETHSAAEVGDEALLAARQAPTWVARQRPAGAAAAVDAGAEAILMDDGFQNPSLAKDLCLLVIDGDFGLGNGRVLPAGPLREAPERALARADAVVLMGEDRAGVTGWLNERRPLIRADLVPGPGGADLSGRHVVAFAGIARPEKFFATLETLGAEVVERLDFVDHHAYRDREVAAIVARAAKLDALAVTTEKDAVRLAPGQRAQVSVLPVSVEWRDRSPLDTLLDRLFAPSARRAG
jgi:tetraacyldisaccharide 4'-kinase